MKARLIVADDHPMVRQGLRDLISTTTDIQIVAEASNGVDAEHLARTVPADLLLLDISMPQRNGVQVLESLRADGIGLPVLFFSMTDAGQYAPYALRIGAEGFVGKEAESELLLEAMRQILLGGTSFPSVVTVTKDGIKRSPAKILSVREKQLLQGLLRGDSLVAIAAELDISSASASTYRRRILDKLGVQNNAELIRLINFENL